MSGTELPACTAYVGLGSNLASPEHQVRSAIERLSELPRSALVKASRLYRTPPMGPQDQPDYVNAVAALETRLAPCELLGHLQAVERALGRVRGAERWGPRIIDLDLLLYGQQRIDREGLHVPHPGLAERAFVLVPLHEIAPALEIPGCGPIGSLLERVDRDAVEAIGVA